MDRQNPYQPSSNPYAATAEVTLDARHPEVYRNGKVLVMHKSATLPDYCIKSNEPTSGFFLKRKLSWHNPWLGLLILINILIYILIAVLVSKKATVMLPLGDNWRSIRRKRLRNTWIFCLGGVTSMVTGMVLAGSGPDSEAIGGLLLLAGILSLLFGILYGMFRARLISTVRIEGDYVHLKGIHPDFLARFESVNPV